MGRSREHDNVLMLIGRIYDAALDPQLWSGLAPQIASHAKSTSAVLLTLGQGHAGFITQSDHFSPAVQRDYERHYQRLDVWAERGAKFALGDVIASKDMVEDSELERSEYWDGYLRPLDIFYVVGSVFPVSDGDVGILGIHRPRRAGTYEEADKARVAEFLPHIKRALQIRRRLNDPGIEKQAALEALERSATATLVVDRNGKILYANGRADEILRDGDALRDIGGRLATVQRAITERLTRMIQAAVDTAAGQGRACGGALAILREDRLPLTVLVAPFRPALDGFGAAAPAAILFIRDPEEPAPASLALQGLFGLTPAEATLAAALAAGKSIDEIATVHGISLNTARTHLKTIFAKTGTCRQAELVALILRSAATTASK